MGKHLHHIKCGVKLANCGARIAKIYPLDAMFDVPEDVPEDIKNNKRGRLKGSKTDGSRMIMI